MNQNKYKMLLVEDETNIRNLVCAMLDTAGYQTIVAKNCLEAQTLFSSYHPDLIILDLGLPDMDGMQLIRYVRCDSVTPIIVLSARTSETDKIDALDAGANDYITKPFGSGELLARVRVCLRSNRMGCDQARFPGAKFVLRDLEIDYEARRVFMKKEEIKLTQTEYNIVALLSENIGKMMTYTTIIKAVWGSYVPDGSIKKLQVNMSNIRKKFGDKPGQTNYIQNELGVGYRMNKEDIQR